MRVFSVVVPFRYIIFLFSLSLLVGCKAFNLRVADNYYNELAYAKAIPKYEKVLRKEFNHQAASRLAESYRNTGNSMKAEIWYRRLDASPMVTLDDRFNFAVVLMENGKYSEASEKFTAYLQYDPTAKKARRLLSVCDSIHLFFEDTTLYQIAVPDFNGEFESNFSPVFFRDGIVFVSDRIAPGKKRMISPWSGKPYLDLFFTSKETGKWSTPQLLKGDINGIFDEGTATFSADFNTVYFTRIDYSGKVIEKNQKNMSLLKLFSGQYTGNLWRLTGPTTFNNVEYSVGHPALSRNGKTLYFVSDMPWGYGGTDIYRADLVNGQWSEPVNLGNAVNTDGNEMFPFIATDSVLYFASDGHLGLGGLDIFSSFWNGESWMKAENLQYPVNSSKDDFGYIIDSTNSHGYFSSNRSRNRDMIYEFKRNPPAFDLLLLAKDNKGSDIRKFELFHRNRKGEKIRMAGGVNGLAKCGLLANTEYQAEIYADGYFTATSRFSTYGLRKSATLRDTVVLVKVDINKPVIWRDIYFNKKEAAIREETTRALDSLVVILNLNPGLEIELGVHTDSRGSFTDNLSLTKSRADAITAYLVEKGISRSRFVAIGYGEGKLINQCRDGIVCIEEDHQVNNRVEVKVVSTGKR